MRYIKTNEGLLTFKSEAKFDKILNELKSFLSEEGYTITESDNNDFFFGRSNKDIIKKKTIIMSKNGYNFYLGIILVKEMTFETPFIHYVLKGINKEGYTGLAQKLQMKISIDISILKEKISEQISDIIKHIDGSVLTKNKELNFYKEFPIEDIKDYLLELFDIFGEYKISKESNLYVVNFTDTFPKLNYISISRFSSSKLYNSTDIFTQLISEFNLLSKRLNSVGLDTYLDIQAATEGKILLLISELNYNFHQ